MQNIAHVSRDTSRNSPRVASRMSANSRACDDNVRARAHSSHARMKARVYPRACTFAFGSRRALLSRAGFAREFFVTAPSTRAHDMHNRHAQPTCTTDMDNPHEQLASRDNDPDRSPSRSHNIGSPERIRTAASALRGRRPGPLDDGANVRDVAGVSRIVLRCSRCCSGNCSGGRTRTSSLLYQKQTFRQLNYPRLGR